MNEDTKEIIDNFEVQLAILFIVIIAFISGCFTGVWLEKKPSRPVGEIIKVDSLVKVNDSIKIKVEQLDSIKDAKIIEVQTLDNDSTLKLFYKLIRK